MGKEVRLKMRNGRDRVFTRIIILCMSETHVFLYMMMFNRSKELSPLSKEQVSEFEVTPTPPCYIAEKVNIVIRRFGMETETVQCLIHNSIISSFIGFKCMHNRK